MTKSRNKIARYGVGFYYYASARGVAMRRIRLDRIDRRILQELQADGRMTNVELAKRVGITAPPCLRRVRALEEAGLIRGYHAALAAEALGFPVTVFAQVGLASQAESDLVAFEKLVRGWPEVREAHMLAGEADFILKIVATDWDSYQRFLSTRLTSAPNVAHVKSAMTLRVSKDEPGVPLGEEG
jgi:DNA-binding Lrp family transcriptional regulator